MGFWDAMARSSQNAGANLSQVLLHKNRQTQQAAADKNRRLLQFLGVVGRMPAGQGRNSALANLQLPANIPPEYHAIAEALKAETATPQLFNTGRGVASITPGSNEANIVTGTEPPPPEQKPRKIVKGADGFNYYADTRERVLPDVKVPDKPETPKPRRIIKAEDGKHYYEDDKSLVLPDVKGLPPKRDIRTDPNGIPRYVDTGEEVFPGIEKNLSSEQALAQYFKLKDYIDEPLQYRDVNDEDRAEHEARKKRFLATLQKYAEVANIEDMEMVEDESIEDLLGKL